MRFICFNVKFISYVEWRLNILIQIYFANFEQKQDGLQTWIKHGRKTQANVGLFLRFAVVFSTQGRGEIVQHRKRLGIVELPFLFILSEHFFN